MTTRRNFICGGTAAAAACMLTASSAAGQARPIRVLSIDGGGLRGIAAAQTITLLDERLRAAYGRGVIDTFDVFAGTSTGSIIAAGLAAADLMGKKNTYPAGLVGLYEQKASRIFPKHWHTGKNLFRPRHSSAGLEQTLREELVGADGRIIQLSQLSKGFLCTYYQLQTRSPGPGEAPDARPHVETAGPLIGPGRNKPLWEVVRASASAPTFFNPKTFAEDGSMNVDGGVFANNPSLLAFVNVRKRHRVSPVEVVSIGCGRSAPTYNTRVNTWGAWEWISRGNGTPLLDVMMRGQSDNIDSIMTALADESDEREKRASVTQLAEAPATLKYHRMQFDLADCSGIGMDDSDPRFLGGLKELASRQDFDSAVRFLRPGGAAAPISGEAGKLGRAAGRGPPTSCSRIKARRARH